MSNLFVTRTCQITLAASCIALAHPALAAPITLELTESVVAFGVDGGEGDASGLNDGFMVGEDVRVRFNYDDSSTLR